MVLFTHAVPLCFLWEVSRLVRKAGTLSKLLAVGRSQEDSSSESSLACMMSTICFHIQFEKVGRLSRQPSDSLGVGKYRVWTAAFLQVFFWKSWIPEPFAFFPLFIIPFCGFLHYLTGLLLYLTDWIKELWIYTIFFSAWARINSLCVSLIFINLSLYSFKFYFLWNTWLIFFSY